MDTKLTKELLNEIFIYKDGLLFRRKNPETEVGWFGSDGYKCTSVGGKTYRVHRLIFMMHHGFFPEIVDHIDNYHLNNSIENLRAANREQNARNCKIPSTNTSGVKGVHWNKQLRKWETYLWIKNKKKCVGFYEDLELAQLVAIEARNKYHGEFARHG